MKILVLGAGSYQNELIQTAKSFGEVFAISNNYSDVGLAFADRSEIISILDYESCLHFVKKESFSAVISSGSQLAAYTQSRLNEVLGLNGFPFDFVRTMTDKYLMRQWFRDSGLSKINFTNEEEQISSSNSWIIKPRIASGSRGVSLYSEATGLDSIANKSCFVKGWMVEEFIDGESGSALFEIRNGKALRLLATKKKINSDFVPIAHVLYDFEESIYSYLQKTVDSMIEQFDLDCGFIDLDFIYTEDRVEIVDIGTRLSGNGLVEMYNQFSEQNLYRVQIKMSLNLPLEELVTLDVRNAGVMLYYSKVKGRLSSYPLEFNDMKILNSIQFFSKGKKVHHLSEGKNQLGFFIFKTIKNAFEVVNQRAKESTIILE